MTAPAFASGVLYVDSRADGNGSGSSWANAYNDLQDALDDADDGTEIWVTGGPYIPDRDSWGKPSGRHDTFTVRGPNIKVFGGFLGHEKSRLERNAFRNQTVLTGEAEKYHVVTIDSYFGADERTVFDGFIVTGGLADGDGKGGDDYGGGMVVYDAGVVLANCWFVANHANYAGGALKIAADDVRIVNCQFSDNSAGFEGFEGVGGAIWSLGGPHLVNCLFHTNFAGFDGLGHAASFWTNIEGAPARMESCTVTNNGPIDPTGRGAIEVEGVLIVRNSVIWGNRTADGTPIEYDSKSDIVIATHNNIEGGFPGSGNISADPLFASSFEESFRLIKASPCTDIGDASDPPQDFGDLDQDRHFEEALPLDLELTPRIYGPGLNLGCFETFDCQANNIGDIVEIAAGTSRDCDENDIPDECDIRDCEDDPNCSDCNGNQQLDGCESDDDCNANGVPDLCELAGNPALDCDADGRIDSCQNGFRDCDANGVADFCQPELNVDTDGDGLIDCLDNCPGNANPDQLDGDENGAGDACDSLLSIGPCPRPITAGPETIEGAHVSFELPAVQSAYGAVVLSATPPSGSLFPIGTSTVVVRATDDGGGDVTCAFEVTVLEPEDDTGQDADCPPLYRMTSGAASFFGVPIGCGPGCLVSIPLTLAGLASVKWRRRAMRPKR
jgi:hypothetical protein